MLKAVIFDMDGVIIDSEPTHTKAAVLVLKEYGIDINIEYIYRFIGSTTHHMCQKMIEDFKINISLEELLSAINKMISNLLKKEGYTVIPYIIDLMKDLHRNKIKLIIASFSPSDAIEEVMESLQIKIYFDGYVSGMMVPNSKPAPDIFMEAAKCLGVKPEECLVIVDSFHGVSAANTAGITCIGFVNPNSGNQDLSKASILVEGFDEVDYVFVNRIYQNAHMEPTTILTTNHFIVRELTIEDIDDLYQIYQNPQITKYLDDYVDNLAVEKEKHKAYIQNIYHYYGFGLWGVFAKDSGRLVGRCGIELKILDGEEVYEIGYLLDQSFQGLGYAKEFVSDTLQYCFTVLNIRRIIAVIDKRNARSIRLAEQIGMHKLDECIRNHRDCYKYEIIYHKSL